MLTEQIIVEIIKNEMNLPNNNVLVGNQEFTIKNNIDLGAVVTITDSIPYGNTNRMECDEAGNFRQIQLITMLENIQIDLYGASNEPLLRKWEVLAALKSLRAQQAAEKYDLKISGLPTAFIENVQTLGGSRLRRYIYNFSVLRGYDKTSIIERSSKGYFDQFSGEVDDEKTIEEAAPLFTIQNVDPFNP